MIKTMTSILVEEWQLLKREFKTKKITSCASSQPWLMLIGKLPNLRKRLTLQKVN
ncbi:hypothetical protein HOLleu_07389 [Holothuria leucospilota]|uniref:Uncharacterized protein n=1 Tax=Holothuria leucospilota TaxID=206669 RepID=A0A9Q1CH98_HOLLE|nr:hypothetical protein HOLleu_07389 [Holothuria leucospilota]